MSRPDWSRPLPRPLTIPTEMKLSTLADVRDLVDKHLPEQYRRKPAWRHVSTEIAKAAEGEKDQLGICGSFRLVWHSTPCAPDEASPADSPAMSSKRTLASSCVKNRHALAYVYFELEEGRRTAANLVG